MEEDKINKAIADLEAMLEDADLTDEQKTKISKTIQDARNKINSVLRIPEEEKGTKSNRNLHIAIGILAFIFIIKLIK